jgi:hypothetical protein
MFLNKQNYTFPRDILRGTEKIPLPKLTDANVHLTKIATLFTRKKQYLSGSMLIMTIMLANVLNFIFNAYLGRVLTYETFGLVSLINSFLYLTAIPFGAMGQTITYRSGFLEERYNSQIAYRFWQIVTKRTLSISLGISLLWLFYTDT